MPSLPIGVRSGAGVGVGGREEGQNDGGAGSGRREREREDPRIAEKKLLDKDDFDPDACKSLEILLRLYLIYVHRSQG
jgi:hypothetical protein